MSNISMYIGINVYRRLASSKVVVYRCFKKLPDDGYAVQSADQVRLPLEPERLRQLETLFWELLIEEAPDIRSGLFPTVEEAIERFEASFEE
jgi:hypothetical protein